MNNDLQRAAQGLTLSTTTRNKNDEPTSLQRADVGKSGIHFRVSGSPRIVCNHRDYYTCRYTVLFGRVIRKLRETHNTISFLRILYRRMSKRPRYLGPAF